MERNNTSRYIAAAILALGVVAVAVVLAVGGSDEAPVPSTTTAAASTTVADTTTTTLMPAFNLDDVDLPADTVRVGSGDDLAALVEASPAGTAFLLEEGVHRLHRVRPKDGNAFYGEPGAVMSGALVIDDFARRSDGWSGLVRQASFERLIHGECQEGFESCADPYELFVDDQLYLQVLDREDLAPGTWYFDEGNRLVILAEDPGEALVELAVTERAFEGFARDVTIKGLTIEKYASPAQRGAVHGREAWDGPTADGWIIEHNVIRQNNGVGVLVGDNFQVRYNVITHNGQMGMGGGGNETDNALWIGVGIVVENNEIAHNNLTGFDWGWEAGGTKFVRADGLIVRGNYVHHNNGPGLWTDIDNINVLVEDNLVTDNQGTGIFHEISAAAVIRNNVVERNGFGNPLGHWSAPIIVSASGDTEVYGNRVVDNAGGIVAIQQERGQGWYGNQVENLWVHHNVVRADVGVNGLRQEVGDGAYFRQRNNAFGCNTYEFGGDYIWDDRELSLDGWQETGNDAPDMSCEERNTISLLG